MTGSDFSKAALLRFLDNAVKQGLFNANTAGGMKAACARLLEDLADTDDVRHVDPATAATRYNNRNSGKLSPPSLLAYQNRLAIVVKEFVAYTANPANYKGRSRGVSASTKRSTDNALGAKRKVTESAADNSPTSKVQATPAMQSAGLSLDFPLRKDFLAQVVVPRDMTSAEANRLSAFVKTLASDFNPD